MSEAKCIYRTRTGDFYFIESPGVASESGVYNFAFVPRESSLVIRVYNDSVFDFIGEWILNKEAQVECSEVAHAYLCELHGR